MRRRWYAFGLLALGVIFLSAWFSIGSGSAPVALATSEAAQGSGEADTGQTLLRVETVKPEQGGIARTTIQPGTVIAFESAQLFAKVSGYLKSQSVDIGSQVKRGQVLAEIDAPELNKDNERAKSATDQAKAEVLQAEARVVTAKADRDSAVAAVVQAEAEVDRAAAARSFREKQYKRIKDLYDSKSVDGRLVDEKLDERDASLAAEHAAQAAVITAKAQVSAATAKVQAAEADVVHAKTRVEVAEAAFAKTEVYVDYTKIVSPYDGVVTKRNFFRGDFIRAADQGGNLPLLAVDQTGVMRVVVQVPDRDVPFTNAGDAADVEIDALPGKKFPAKVSRVADAEDQETRTMRVEIDLANDKHLLRQGMYGRVTIHLDEGSAGLSIPASCLSGTVDDGQGTVYVVKNGVARRQGVVLGTDNGLRVEVLKGLSARTTSSAILAAPWKTAQPSKSFPPRPRRISPVRSPRTSDTNRDSAVRELLR